MYESIAIKLFCTLWWETVLITSLVITGILFIGKKLNPANKDKLAFLIGFIILISYICKHSFGIYLGIWNAQKWLPLELCRISKILCIVLMLNRSQILYEALFYLGICGGINAILFPEITLGESYIFFALSYILHGGIILYPLYLTIVLGMTPRKGSWLRLFLLLQPLIPIVGAINLILGSNYIYLCKLPIANCPLLIGTWPWYILFIDFIAMINFFIAYLPIAYYHRSSFYNDSYEQ